MISAALAILKTDEERNELSEIYERNKDTFYSIALSKLHTKHDAEDAVQEAFLAIAKNPEVFFGISPEHRVSYINVIIRNISFKLWNKKNHIVEKETELYDDIPDEHNSTEEEVLNDASCDCVLRFIDTLPEGTKAAIYLRMSLELKNSEIANVLGITEDAVKKRISRGLQQIKQYMEELKNE